MMLKVPITKPYLSESEGRAAAEVVATGWISQGSKVAEFEEAVANYVGAEFGVATSNCTTALHVCLICLGIGPGDEVIVPSFTFIATSNSILHAGATPVFVDIDPRTYNIDVAKIEGAVTESTRAIMPVHQIGLAADMDPILELAERHRLHVIEDAAPSIGEEYKGRRVGSIGEVACFSFHPRKVVTTGEGGMITTDSEALASRAKIIRSHGASISDLARHKADEVIFEEYPYLGYNYRMTDIEAAIGLEQMKKLDEMLAVRRRLAERYDQELTDVEGLDTPHVPPYAKHTYQSYIVRVRKDCPLSRNEIMREMLKEGIATRRGVMAIHLEPYYRERFGEIRLPVTEEATRSTLLIPLFPAMTEDEQSFVISTLRRIVQG
jgi:perosamine synthetase